MGYKIRVSARGIILHEGKLLINKFGDGQYYNFPGGGIEPGETAPQALVREIKEETGLDASVGEMVLALEYEPESCGHSHGPTHHLSLFFRCGILGSLEITDYTQPDVNPDDPTLIARPVWVAPEALDGLALVPAIQAPLLDYLRTGLFHPLYWNACEHP